MDTAAAQRIAQSLQQLATGQANKNHRAIGGFPGFIGLGVANPKGS